MKREPDYFEGAEPKLIYIARKLDEALEVEKLLSDAAIDYGVEPDTYRGGFLFQTERVGAFFYVRSECEAQAREFLTGTTYPPVPLS